MANQYQIKPESNIYILSAFYCLNAIKIHCEILIYIEDIDTMLSLLKNCVVTLLTECASFYIWGNSDIFVNIYVCACAHVSLCVCVCMCLCVCVSWLKISIYISW